MSSPTLQKLDELKHQALRDLLAQCTPAQQDLFNRMYGSVERVPKAKMDWAIQQCERTIEKNNKLQGLTKEIVK